MVNEASNKYIYFKQITFIISVSGTVSGDAEWWFLSLGSSGIAQPSCPVHSWHIKTPGTAPALCWFNQQINLGYYFHVITLDGTYPFQARSCLRPATWQEAGHWGTERNDSVGGSWGLTRSHDSKVLSCMLLWPLFLPTLVEGCPNSVSLHGCTCSSYCKAAPGTCQQNFQSP